MAELRYDIIGNNSSLSAAIKQSTAGFTDLEKSAQKANAEISVSNTKGLTGLQVLIRELNKDFQNGKISANQFKEAIDIANSNQTQNLGRSTAQIKEEIGAIQAVKAEIISLNKQKILASADNLPSINKKIQEAGFELSKLDKVGTVQGANAGFLSFGKKLSDIISPLRTIAYIVPGIGLAGIFNLGFEAITAAATSLNLFNTGAEKTAKELKDISDAENDKFGKSGYVDSAVALSNLTEKIKLAKGGFLDKNAVLKEYNETLGKTIGEVNSLDAAEQKIVDKGPAYLKFLLLKAKAEFAFKKAAEDSYNASVAQDKLDAKKPQFSGDVRGLLNSGKLGDQPTSETLIKPLDGFLRKSNDVTGKVVDNIQKVNVANKNLGLASELAAKKQVDSLNKSQGASQKAAQKSFDEFNQFAKDQGFTAFDVKPDKSVGGGDNAFASLSKQLDEILRKTQSLSGQSGLTGYALEVQKVTDKYIQLNKEVDNTIASANRNKNLTGDQRNTLNSKAATDRDAFSKAQAKELDDTFNTSVDKALEATDKIIKARQEAADKTIKLEQDLQDKISDINDIAAANIGGKQETETDKINLEWDKRKKSAKDYYDELIRLNNATPNDPKDPLGFNKAIKGLKIQGNQIATNNLIDQGKNSQISNKLLEPFSKGIDQGLRKFATDFYSTLTDVDTYAKGTFSSIFADLTGKLTTSLNQVFLNVVVQGLSNALQKAISGGTGGLTNADGSISGKGAVIAAAAAGGAIISSATPKTSTLGQAAGGALSGAATGAAIGSVIPGIGTAIGAVAGGLIGALSGIFGSASARKKEEDQRQQQLEEAKKQTAIQKAQLDAYTSSIVGRVTSAGVVTSVAVGAQGNLVASISGKDIQFVLDRNAKTR